MEHLAMVPSVPPPRSKSRKKSTHANKRHTSFVWHYFNVLGDKVKCRICQHELTPKQDSSTAQLIWHLERTHGLRRGIRVKNLSSLPTRLVQSSNRVLCMRERVFKSFAESSGGIWRCIHCNYAFEDKKLMPMFHHLKAEHWKASRPIAETLIRKNDNLIAENGTKWPQIKEIQSIGNGMIPFVDLSAKQCPKVVVKNEPHDGDALDDDAVMDSSSVKHCSVIMNLLGENNVEDFDVESKNGPEKVESAVSLDHSYRNGKLQSLTPMAFEKTSSSNQQRVVEEGHGSLENDTYIPKILTRDDKRKFDHWYSRKSCREPAASTSMQIKTRRSLPDIQKSYNPGNGSGRIEDEELDSQVEIQVPLENLPRLIAGVRDTNAKTPISYEYIKTCKAGNKLNVAVITLSRPKALNALSIKLMDELNNAVVEFDSDKDIGAIIITGSDRAFAAGNDIKEMQKLTYARTISQNVLRKWDGISKANKPVIAAVNGYAVGGGCELAMMCDIIYAGENALFGQPEIVIGTIPGAGGTQRLTRVIGKSKAMEMVLTGNQISAVEAEKSGLVSKVFPPDQLLDEAIKLGERISAHSQLIVAMAKEAVNTAYETNLQEGLRLEAKLSSGTLATADRREGIAAFIAKRAPNFENE